MDDTDIASRHEQRDRELALATQRYRAVLIDVAPQVCAGCDARPQQKACIDFETCLADFDKRRAARVRNGRPG